MKEETNMSKEMITFDLEEERNRRIEEIGNYFIDNDGPSTRNIAEYFSNNKYKISNKTVHSYIELFEKRHSDKKEIIDSLIDKNKEKDITTEERQKQILVEFGLLLKGYTCTEIAKILDTSFSSIQRDLTSRLKKLGENDEIYDNIYQIASTYLNQNQTSTIESNRKQWK